MDKLITPVAGRYAAGSRVVRHKWARGRAITHDGSNASCSTILMLAPRVGLAYVVAANSAEADVSQTSLLLDGIVSELITRGSR